MGIEAPGGGPPDRAQSWGSRPWQSGGPRQQAEGRSAVTEGCDPSPAGQRWERWRSGGSHVPSQLGVCVWGGRRQVLPSPFLHFPKREINFKKRAESLPARDLSQRLSLVHSQDSGERADLGVKVGAVERLAPGGTKKAENNLLFPPRAPHDAQRDQGTLLKRTRSCRLRPHQGGGRGPPGALERGRWRGTAARRLSQGSHLPQDTYVDDDGEFPDASEDVVPDAWGERSGHCRPPAGRQGGDLAAPEPSLGAARAGSPAVCEPPQPLTGAWKRPVPRWPRTVSREPVYTLTGSGGAFSLERRRFNLRRLLPQRAHVGVVAPGPRAFGVQTVPQPLSCPRTQGQAGSSVEVSEQSQGPRWARRGHVLAALTWQQGVCRPFPVAPEPGERPESHGSLHGASQQLGPGREPLSRGPPCATPGKGQRPP